MSFGPIEYGAAVTLTSVGSRPFKPALVTKHSGVPQILEGWACLYGVIHRHKDRWEIFEKGCFEGSLFGVMVKVDHNISGITLGDQDDGSLELVDSDVGLGFRLKLAPGHLEIIDGRDNLSPCYIEHDVETRTIGGDTVRVIKSASLFEISVCYVGAMRTTYAVVRDANKAGSLSDAVRNSFASEGAGINFLRKLRALENN